MRRSSVWVCCLILVLSMTGCGSSDSAAPETSAAGTETQAESTSAESESGDDAAQVPSYEVSDYVTLGTYTGFTVDKVKTEVSEEAIEEAIEYELEENAEEVEKVDGAENGNYLTIEYKVTVNGEEVPGASEDSREIMLGFAELGEEVDEELIDKKVKAGDSVSAAVVLDDTYGEEWEGQEALFDVTVDRVYMYVTPELTEDYVAEYTEYDSVEAYRAGIEANLLKETEETNLTEAGELALGQAVEQATITGYPNELYESTYNEMLELYEYYAEMFGAERSDLISDEDLEQYVLDDVYSSMVVRAIADAEGLNLSDEEFQAYLEENLEDYGCTSIDELYQYYEESELRDDATRERVLKFLLDSCEIQEMSEEEYEAKYYPAEESDEEIEISDEGDDWRAIEDLDEFEDITAVGETDESEAE